MSSLSRFQIPPPPDLLSIGETSGAFIYGREDRFFLAPSQLGREVPPRVSIDFKSGEGDNTTLVSFSAAPPSDRQPFVDVEEHWIKTAWSLMRNEGAMKVLEFLSKEEDDGPDERRRGQYIAMAATSCLRRLHSLLSPNVNTEEVCSQYAGISLWSTSIIREISIHPTIPLMAIARKDDVILIQNTLTQHFHRPLKDKHQHCIASLEWAPHSNLLAVGVAGGVVLWYIDSNLRPTSTFLPCFSGQEPVTTISWCPSGKFLACGSPCNSTLLVLDVHMRTSSPLKRFGGGGISHVSWSSDGGRLLVCHKSLFRVWETGHWTCETWSQLASCCNGSCWSPKGNILVFSVEGDPSLYYIKFPSHDATYNTSISEAAIKCADVSEVCLEDESEVISVGGSVQSLAWDHTGERLAVLFTANSPGANRIAVFRTQCEPVLDLIPGGFVQWIEGEIPVWIGFKCDSRNWSILVSAWSDGNIILTPLSNSKVFSEPRPSSFTLFSTT